MSDTLRAFRSNAVHVRHGLAAIESNQSRVTVDAGYLRDEGRIDRFKRLSIPVRRALNPNDRASFAHALAALTADDAPRGVQLDAVERAWHQLQQELDSLVGFGGSRVPRRQILAGWLEAAAFYDKLDRDRAYDRLIERWGTAAEGLGSQLMADTARVVLLLDEAAAAALGEPVILPPPQKTPPPPPDPKDPWWKRLFT